MRKGFTLIEVLVSLFIFTLVVLAAYKIYDHSQKTYLLGEQLTDAQQSTRFAFEKISHDLRLAGYRVYPDSDALRPDLSIEAMWDGAIAIRADFEATEENDLECTIVPSTGMCSSGTGRFGLVTTGNRDIRVYCLAKKAPAAGSNTDPTAGDGSDETLSFKADFSDNRDAAVGDRDDLETVTIPGVSLTQDKPPYKLYVVTFLNPSDPGYVAVPAGGDVPAGNIVWTPVAEGIFSMRFDYYNQNGIAEANRMVIESFGSASNFDPPDATEPEDKNLFLREHGWPFGVGGGTMVKNVLVRLVGMTARPDGRYTDPQIHNADLTTEERAARTLTKMHRKYELNTSINMLNVGVAPHELADTIPPDDPSELMGVVGYCGGALLVWTPSLAADLATYYIQIVDDSLWSTWGDTFLYLCDDAPDTCTPVSNVEIFGTTVGYYRPNLNNGDIYHARVFAQDAAGNFSRNPTNEIEFTVDPGPLKPLGAVVTGSTAADVSGLHRLQVSFTPPQDYDVTQNAVCIGEVADKDGAWPKIRDLYGYRLYHRRQRSATPVDFTVDPVTDLIADEQNPADNPLKIPLVEYPDLKACPCEYYAYKMKSTTQCEDADDDHTQTPPCLHVGEVSELSQDADGNPIAYLTPALQDAGIFPQVVPAQPDKPGGSSTGPVGEDYEITLQIMPVLTSALKASDGAISPNADPTAQFEVWRYRIYEFTEDPIADPSATATRVDDTNLGPDDFEDWDAGVDAMPAVASLGAATPVKFTFTRTIPSGESRYYTVAGIYRCDAGADIIEGPQSLPAQVPCETDWTAVVTSPFLDYTLVNTGGAVFPVRVAVSGLPSGVTIVEAKITIAGTPVANQPMALTCVAPNCTATFDWNITGLPDNNYTILVQLLDSSGCSITVSRIATIAMACGAFQIHALPVSGTPTLDWELQKINGTDVYLLDKIGFQSLNYQTNSITYYQSDPTAGAPTAFPLWTAGPQDLNGKSIGNPSAGTDFPFQTTNFSCDLAGTIKFPSLNLNLRPGGPAGTSNWFRIIYNKNLTAANGPLNLLGSFRFRPCEGPVSVTVDVPKGANGSASLPVTPICAWEWSYIGTAPTLVSADLCGPTPTITWKGAKSKGATVTLKYWAPSGTLTCPNMPILLGP